MRFRALTLGGFVVMLGGTASAADFTVGNLHTASQVATTTFKTDYGTALHDAIYGIQATKGRDSSRIKLFYREADAPRTIEYFCHFHDEDELDCHEH